MRERIVRVLKALAWDIHDTTWTLTLSCSSEAEGVTISSLVGPHRFRSYRMVLHSLTFHSEVSQSPESRWTRRTFRLYALFISTSSASTETSNRS